MDWINVKDRLPEQKEHANDICDPVTLAVLDTVHDMVSDLVLIAVTGEDGERFVLDDVLVNGKWENASPDWEVTHWQPLPQPPKED